MTCELVLFLVILKYGFDLLMTFKIICFSIKKKKKKPFGLLWCLITDELIACEGPSDTTGTINPVMHFKYSLCLPFHVKLQSCSLMRRNKGSLLKERKTSFGKLIGSSESLDADDFG